MTSRVKGVVAGVLVLAGGAAVAAILAGSSVSAGPRGPAPSATRDGRLVLVSGRDDHGLLAQERVALRDRPAADAVPVGQVPDGTLARVVTAQGTWLEVRTAEGTPVQGWVDDFFLRGGVHLVGPAPTCTVPFEGQSLPEGEQAVVLDVQGNRARVRINRTGATGWVDRPVVREIVPEPCGQPDDTKPTDGHHHHGG